MVIGTISSIPLFFSYPATFPPGYYYGLRAFLCPHPGRIWSRAHDWRKHPGNNESCLGGHLRRGTVAELWKCKYVFGDIVVFFIHTPCRSVFYQQEIYTDYLTC